MGLGALLAAKALVILSAVTGIGGGREMLGDITGTIRYLRNPGTPTFTDPLTYRADGGFVSSGQMFVAREAGSELVGTIGRRTAVANNDQIVESVARGVFEAVSAANAGGNSNGNNRPLEVKLYLDGKQITAAVEREIKDRGLPLLTSGIHAKRILMAKGLV